MSIAGARSNIDINWRTIDIDALDPESSSNFDLTTLTPAITPISAAEVQTLAGQIRQLLRGGDSEGALRGALENVPYGADEGGKVGNNNNKSRQQKYDKGDGLMLIYIFVIRQSI